MLPIFELVIDEESDGVNLVSFVGEPAIKANWVAFSEIDEELLKIQKEVMLSDYPEAAVNNAKRAIKHKEENGSSCGTQVGWIRARQIANKESFDEAMIKRIFSFLSRAKTYDQGKYVDENGSEICGSIMYDAWGGDAMKTWAERKLNQFESERKGQKMSSQEHLFQIESEEKRIVSGPILLADFPIIRADENGEPYFVVLKADTIEKTAQKFFKNSNHLGTNKNHNKQELVDGVYMFESYIIDRCRMTRTKQHQTSSSKNTKTTNGAIAPKPPHNRADWKHTSPQTNKQSKTTATQQPTG